MNSELKTIWQKLSWRIILLIALLPLFNWIYSSYFWDRDVYQHAEVLQHVQKSQDSCEVLYFGESSNFSYHPTRDSLEDRISDFVSYHYPTLHFGTINHAAYHAGLFVPLIEQINKESAVKTVIVTMNLRTFDQAVTHSPLETAMQQEKVFYFKRPPLANRSLLSLRYYDDKTELERSAIMWNQWTYDTLKSDVDSIIFQTPTIRSWCEVVKYPDEHGKENMEKRSLADHYIKAYAFVIDEQNPRIADFDRIVEICKEKNFNLVFNLLAENVEYADSLVGNNLVWLMRKNRDYLVNRYSSEKVLVVDNLEIVGAYHFTDQHWTTEHYDQIGRQLIARNVARAMSKWYTEQYKEKQIVVLN